MEKVKKYNLPKEKYLLVLLSTVATGVTLLLTGYAAFISNSVTLFADFLKCLVEFLSILLSFVVLRKIKSSDQSRYNYGFGKLEQLSSSAVAFALLCSGMVCIATAIDRMISPESLSGATFGYVLAILSVFGNGILWAWFTRVKTKDPSPVAESQAVLFYSKTLASLIVVISITLSLYSSSFPFLVYSDALGSLVIALFLIISALSIGRNSFADLVDRAVDEAFLLTTYLILVQYEDAYAGFHGLRSRQVGMKKIIQINLSFREDRTMKDIGPRLKEMKKTIENKIPYSEVILALKLPET